jgi:hypothetical protein
MKHILLIGTLFLALLAGPAPLFGGEDGLREQMKALNNLAARAEKDRAGKGPVSSEPMAQDGSEMLWAMGNFRSNYQQVESYLNSGDDDSALRTLRSWKRSSRSPQLRKMLDALEDEIRKSVAERVKKLTVQAQALLKGAGEACLAAKKPSDLDDVINRMSDFLSDSEGRMPARMNRLRSQVENGMRFVEQWQDLLDAEASLDWDLTAEILSNLRNYDRQSRVISKSALAGRMAKAREPIRAMWQKELNDVRESLSKASTVVDVQKVQETLISLCDEIHSANSMISGEALREQASQARDLLGVWIQVLMSEQTGRWLEALDRIRDMEYRRQSNPIIPASARDTKKAVCLQKALAQKEVTQEVLAKEIGAVMTDLAKTNDLNAALRQVNAYHRVLGHMNTDSRDWQEINYLVCDLQICQRMQTALEQGKIRTLCYILNEGRNPHAWSAQIDAVRNRLFEKTLASIVNSKDLKLGATAENPAKAVETFVAQAVQKNDWSMALRVMEAMQQLMDRNFESSVRSIRAYLAGQNLEKFQQFRDAVKSYQITLSSYGEWTPIQQAGARLVELKKTHPEAFEETENKVR